MQIEWYTKMIQNNHSLTDTDMIKLREFEKAGLYVDTIQYMIEKNVKLEQEIVSLMLMKMRTREIVNGQ